MTAPAGQDKMGRGIFLALLEAGPTEALQARLDAVDFLDLVASLNKGLAHTITRVVDESLLDDTEDRIMLVLERADIHGFAEIVQLYLPGTILTSFVEPIRTLMTGGYQRAIRFFLARGFDPRKLYDGFSAIDMAGMMDDRDMENMLLSWEARRAVDTLLCPSLDPGPSS